MKMKRYLLAAAALWAAFSLPAYAQRSDKSSFFPDFGTGQTLSATTTSSSITITGNGLNDSELRITNLGTDVVYCRWGVGAQTATTADMVLLSGQSEVMGRNGATVVACIAAATTATVRVIEGNGNVH